MSVSLRNGLYPKPGASKECRSPASLSEYEIVVSVLDMENAGNYDEGPPGKSKPKPDQVFGKDINFIQVLPEVLSVIARTLRRNTLSDVLKFPQDQLLAARDDVRGALAISRDFYDATKWMYGNRAFGMRLAAGLSRSAASQRALLVLGFTLLKRSRYAFISSDQIAALVRPSGHCKAGYCKAQADWRDRPAIGSLNYAKGVAGRVFQCGGFREVSTAGNCCEDAPIKQCRERPSVPQF
jgi:hypothetical protein